MGKIILPRRLAHPQKKIVYSEQVLLFKKRESIIRLMFPFHFILVDFAMFHQDLAIFQ